MLAARTTRRAERGHEFMARDADAVDYHKPAVGCSHAPSMPAGRPVAYGEAMGDIKLGYNTGYWSAGPPKGALEGIKEAERLGFNSVWTAEAYGSDALTPLAWWGAATEKLKLGTAIMQIDRKSVV